MKVSIVIKALNEERNIERAIVSALRAAEAVGDTEVILADSKSSDDTVAIAARYGVRIVQLRHAHDRSCGIGAELGYRVARGRFIYILDADMEIEPEFLKEAVAELERDMTLAGVGGLVQEMNVTNAEFRGRTAQNPPHMQAGEVDRLNMGGLYRRTDIEAAGYLTNRNLHAFEEVELAVRLRAIGRKLKRLNMTAVRHYGHTDASFSLLWRRWKSRYAWGAGELLRSGLGKDYLPAIYRSVRVYHSTALLAGYLVCVLAGAIWLSLPYNLLMLPMAALPVLAAAVKRRSFLDGLYTVTLVTTFGAGIVAGLIRRPRHHPTDPIDTVILKN